MVGNPSKAMSPTLPEVERYGDSRGLANAFNNSFMDKIDRTHTYIQSQLQLQQSNHYDRNIPIDNSDIQYLSEFKPCDLRELKEILMKGIKTTYGIDPLPKHLMSGSLDELLPNWKELNSPIKTKVSKEKFLFLGKTKSLSWPTWLLPAVQQNHKNYIISLANLCRWLAEQAEALGVEIFPGFPANEILYNEDGSVKGVATQDMGIDKEGNKKDSFEPGIELLGKVTVFAEGCRGHLGKQLIEKFNLSKDKDPQQYGIGFKEIWEIDEKNHEEGLVMHTAGWPLDNSTYGGSFMYHAENKQVFLGYVIGLDYKNPYLSPFDEFQRFKTHPAIKKIIEGGKRISCGARALIEGGFQSLPKMYMPGALLIGCDAGTLNMPKIKGSHTAMKSGMIAAETIFENIKENES